MHIAKFWLEELFDEIEDGHSLVCKMYSEDDVLRAAIDQHDHYTCLNDVWDVSLGRLAFLRSSCGGLASVFADSTLRESDGTSLMHLSLEGISQTQQRSLLELLMQQCRVMQIYK